MNLKKILGKKLNNIKYYTKLIGMQCGAAVTFHSFPVTTKPTEFKSLKKKLVVDMNPNHW